MTTSSLPAAPPETEPKRIRAAAWTVPAAVVVVLVLWASAFVAIRSAAHSFSPGPLALIRLVVGAVLLGGAALRGPRRPALPRGRALGLVLLYGLAWFGGYNLALNAAERHLDPGTSRTARSGPGSAQPRTLMRRSPARPGRSWVFCSGCSRARTLRPAGSAFTASPRSSNGLART